MKKSKSLLVWTIITLLGIIIALGSLVFWGVKDFTLLTGTLELSQLGWSNLLSPVTYYAYSTVVGLSLGLAFYVFVGILAVTLLMVIFVIIMAFVRKKAVHIWSVILLLLTGTVILWLAGFYLYPEVANSTETGIALQLINPDSVYFQTMAFGAGNIGVSILFNVTLLGVLVTVVGFVGYWIAALAYGRRVKVTDTVEEPVVEAVAADAVEDETLTLPVEETEEAPVEEPVKPRKKVVLVLKRYDALAGTTEPVIEKPAENYPHEPLNVKPLTRDDIREVLKEELDAREAKLEKTEVTEQKAPVSVTESDRTTETVEECLIPTPVVVAIPELIERPTACKKEKVQEPKESLDKEAVTQIIRDEFKKVFDEYVQNLEPTIIEETVEEVKEVPVQTIVKEVIKEVQVPVEKIVEVEKVVEVEKPVEKIVEVEKVVEVEKPVEKEPEPVVIQVQPETVEEETSVEAEPKPKIERIPFSTRIQDADDELKDTYNQLKSLLVSYGLKSRISSGGDTFRLHNVTYCKITVSGKSLKLYMNLNPDDYKNTTLPIKDASSKAIYADIPLVFKVKSGLSLRRAESLIADMMDKHQIDQTDRVEVKDYVSLIANEKTSDDDIDDDDAE